MNKAIEKELHRVVDLCMEIQTTTAHDVFFGYSGHINCFNVSVHINGYEANKNVTYLAQLEKTNLLNLKRARRKLLKYKEQRT